MALIELTGLRRSFDVEGGGRVHALRDVSLRIDEGEFVCITGPSGSGKSTLLNLLGCLDQPTGGSYLLEGREVGELRSDTQALLRRRVFGFVFQSYNLLDMATALDNVALPGRYAGLPQAACKKRAQRLLAKLGLADRSGNLPAELSGGERQRVALARALMNGGRVILADEPTGSLDTGSAGEVLKALEEIAEGGHTVVLVTHNPAIAARAPRCVQLLDGRVVSDSSAGSERLKKPDAEPQDSLAGGTAGVLEAIRSGLRSLGASFRRGQRLRVALTVLGIAVAVWLGGMSLLLGEAVYWATAHAINETGLETITVMRTGKLGRDGSFLGLTMDDAIAIEKEIANVRAVSPGQAYHGVFVQRGDVAAEFGVEGFVDRGTKEGRAHVGYRLASGEFITPQDDDGLERVAVLDSVARDRLFPPDVDPVGQEINIQGVSFRVKGVYEYRTGFTIRTEGEPEAAVRAREEILNSGIYIPFATGYALLADSPLIFSISVFLENPDQLIGAARAIKELGIRRYGEDVYSVEHWGALIQAAKRQRGLMRFGLGAIAGIALLAMNLSVMSIMVMAVRTRRREIGVRIAVGARRRDILWQFLTEAAALNLAGGALGVIAVLACIPALNHLGLPAGYSPFIWAPCAGALLVGLAFGVMPAQRAARLNPVAALASD